MKEPEGHITPMINTGETKLAKEVIDSKGNIFVRRGLCLCCEGIIWMPLVSTHKDVNFKITMEYDDKLDGDINYNKKVCIRCHNKLHYYRRKYLL